MEPVSKERADWHESGAVRSTAVESQMDQRMLVSNAEPKAAQWPLQHIILPSRSGSPQRDAAPRIRISTKQPVSRRSASEDGELQSNPLLTDEKLSISVRDSRQSAGFSASSRNCCRAKESLKSARPDVMKDSLLPSDGFPGRTS